MGGHFIIDEFLKWLWGKGGETAGFLKMKKLALADVAQWIEHELQTKGSPVRFPVRAHVWVAGQVGDMPEATTH